MASSFDLTAKHFEEASRFVSSFKGTEGVIRITVSKTGVNLRIMEDGILGSCNLPIIATGQDDMYLKYSVFSNILSASHTDTVKMEIKTDNLVQVTIDGVLLNLSPEFYTGVAFQLPDLSDPLERVSIKSDLLAIIAKKVSIPSTSESTLTPVMKIGSQWRYGTGVNITLFEVEETEDVDWTVSSVMLKYIQNIAKLNQEVELMHTHGEFEDYFVIQSSYTTYWTTMSGMEPIDITEFMTMDIAASSSWSKSSDISTSLEKLRIPLIGSVDEPHILVTLSENKTKLLVTDLANRVSYDIVESEGQVAYDEPVELNFGAFANVIKKMDSNLPFQVDVKETAVIFTQQKLVCLISRYI